MSETLPMTMTPASHATLMVHVARSNDPDDWRKIEEQIRDLIEQRDALLAACNAVLNDDMASLRMVREAVAKATK